MEDDPMTRGRGRPKKTLTETNKMD